MPPSAEIRAFIVKGIS